MPRLRKKALPTVCRRINPRAPQVFHGLCVQYLMMSTKNTRLSALAVMIIFVSTIAVLLARQFDIGPERPSPGFRTFGSAVAPVQIQEYSDFACGACRTAAAVTDELIAVYGEAIRLQLKHYPLVNIHPWSLDAAAHADCAGEQGKFKEYAALLFESQEKWGRAVARPGEFETFARELSLDWPEMRACAAAPETVKRIKLEMAEAEMKGVNATPTFFINGKRAVGPAQFAAEMRKFDAVIAVRRQPPGGKRGE